MSDPTNLNKNTDDMSNLVFDWTNPSMSTRSKRETEAQRQRPAPTEETAGLTEEELKEAVRARKDELMQQRREKAAASRSAAGRKGPVRRAAAGTRGADSPGKRTMVRIPAVQKEEKRKAGGLGIAYRSPSGGKKKPADRKLLMTRIIGGGAVAAIVLILIWAVLHMTGGSSARTVKHIDTSLPEYVTEDYLTVNSYTRPGIANSRINGIVVHYTANPGSTAKETRDYFESLSASHETRASSHFIIGLEGEVLICVPLDELAYASNSRNMDTISIECCHPDETGTFTEETYASLVQLTSWLMTRFNLTEEDILRHYDVTGKLCPRYFVEHEDAWEKFLRDVQKAG